MRPAHHLRWLLQSATFFRKEAVDVLRQPRILLTLVLGPFLLMAIFGLGYRETAAPMRTVFVVAADSPLAADVQRYADQIGDYVHLVGVTSDDAAAKRLLQDGDVDLVVEFPADPLADVLKDERATVTVEHTRLDPVEQAAITFATQLAVDRINSEVLSRVVGGAQGFVKPAGEAFDAAAGTLDDVAAAVSAGDTDATRSTIADLEESTAQIAISIRVATALTDRFAANDATSALATKGDELAKAADDLANAVSRLDENASTTDVEGVRQLLGAVKDDFSQFTSIDPDVLVAPLRAEVRLAVKDVGGVSDWYAPAAVVLVLQQFGIAFGALSFVRERQLGVVEVLRVAPLGPTVTLIGKYLAYLCIGGAIGALLTAMVVQLLGVPLQSGLGDVAIVMALTLFASIGLGLLISLVSGTDAQAVQYTMMILLASLFFSGFFLSVDQMQGFANAVSWALPVTYGMKLLRDLMLRGAPLDPELVAGLAVYGAVTFVLVLLGARRRLSQA